MQHGSGTVLVVDDDLVLRRLICDALHELGYTALEAADAEAAEHAFSGHPGGVGLLLTDIVMPGANGRELARRLCGMDPALRVIFMSGYSDETISRHGVLEDGLHYLQKPFDLPRLGGKIREVLAAAPGAGPALY